MPAEPVLAGVTDEAAPDLAGQLAVLADLGWSHVELSTVAGRAVADLDDGGFTSVAGELAARGVRVVGMASRIGGWARPISGPFGDDLAELDVLLRRCAVLGARFVRIGSYPNAGLSARRWRDRVVGRVSVLAELAEAAGVVLVHENRSGWVGGSAERALDLLDAVGSPALKLLFDTGDGVARGYDGYALLREVVAHVAHVHVRDAAGSRPVPPGSGDARVADCVRLLRANGYRGAWSLVPRGARPADPAFLAAGRALAALVR
ncbi:sugar phosphate isomerase/epimerase family protein [Actinosynnema sp. NPDC053489]|uniref:sugar phosphate isomerase/epimerase family protein n=1 Tax=Actinosynnema sp. NPDC053489 TaxID=3363916 RepID=UPI0037C634DA